MPTVPWTSIGEVDAAHDYVVMASRLPLARYRDIPAFLRASLDIRRQLAKSDGLIGYGLEAHFLRRTFWTLSVWRDDDALARFAHADPHNRHVARIRPHMNSSTFVTWAVPGAQLPVTWTQARQRVEAAA
jgi:hypothetical protein